MKADYYDDFEEQDEIFDPHKEEIFDILEDEDILNGYSEDCGDIFEEDFDPEDYIDTDIL